MGYPWNHCFPMGNALISQWKNPCCPMAIPWGTMGYHGIHCDSMGFHCFVIGFPLATHGIIGSPWNCPDVPMEIPWCPMTITWGTLGYNGTHGNSMEYRCRPNEIHVSHGFPWNRSQWPSRCNFYLLLSRGVHQARFYVGAGGTGPPSFCPGPPPSFKKCDSVQC